MKNCVLLFIKCYKRFLSPFIGNECRFYPTCSQYCMDAIEQYGVIRGIIKGAWRIVRCNPLTPGGFDPAK